MCNQRQRSPFNHSDADCFRACALPLPHYLISQDSAQRAVESEWNDRRKRILARHAESAKRREEELYEHGAQKLKRLGKARDLRST